MQQQYQVGHQGSWPYKPYTAIKGHLNPSDQWSDIW